MQIDKLSSGSGNVYQLLAVQLAAKIFEDIAGAGMVIIDVKTNRIEWYQRTNIFAFQQKCIHQEGLEQMKQLIKLSDNYRDRSNIYWSVSSQVHRQLPNNCKNSWWKEQLNRTSIYHNNLFGQWPYCHSFFHRIEALLLRVKAKLSITKLP